MASRPTASPITVTDEYLSALYDLIDERFPKPDQDDNADGAVELQEPARGRAKASAKKAAPPARGGRRTG